MQDKKVNVKKISRDLNIPGQLEKIYEIPGVSRSFQEKKFIPGYIFQDFPGVWSP